MTTTTEQVKTNDLKYSNDLRHSILSHDSEGNNIYIKIELNDDCKNGHQDFSITGDIYQAGKPKIDKYHLSGGCIHEEILKARPDLKIFVELHLCDYEGIPTYAVENGFYHLREGFNNTKPEDPEFRAKFCEYYRVSGNQFDVLNTSKNQTQYALNIQKLGILEQWKRQADKAIELLEGMTGKKFLVDSVKTQFHAPTEDEIKEEEKRQKEGYYTKEAQAKREEAKRDKLLAALQADCDKEIKKATTEFEVKKQVLFIGGEKALDNCIFYNHSNTLAFNWRGYDKLSQQTIDKIISEIKLPEGVKIENKNQ